jgi:uncharacterized protein (TIGR02270 family)
MAALLWDVQWRHLAEAEFNLEVWEGSLSSPVYTLEDVRVGPEERVMAHVMGLVIGGAPVLKRLVRPVLDQELDLDRFRTAAAALAVLDGGGREGPDVVFSYFPKVRAGGWWGLIRAAHLSRRTDIAERILAEIAPLEGTALAGRLEVLAGLGVDAGKHLRTWLRHQHPAIRRVASRLARHSSSSKVLRQLLSLMEGSDPWLREAAIESALIRGLPGSWQVACEVAFDRASPPNLRRAALNWVAMQGDASVHARILAELQARPSATLLRAALITGRPHAIAIAVELLEHPVLARIAGEVVGSIGGLSTRDHRFWLDEGTAGGYGADANEALPALAHDQLDADLIPPEHLRMRLPDARRIREWWYQTGHAFSPELRWLDGQPMGLAAVKAALHDAPMRRRHALALELAIRSAGTAILDTRAPARMQLTQMDTIFARLEAQGGVDFQAGFPIL